jgi:hypothetical protein
LTRIHCKTSASEVPRTSPKYANGHGRSNPSGRTLAGFNYLLTRIIDQSEYRARSEYKAVSFGYLILGILVGPKQAFFCLSSIL